MRTRITPLYHVLIKTPRLAFVAEKDKRPKENEELAGIKTLARRHKIQSLVCKIGHSARGIAYAESEDKKALQRFEEDVGGLHRDPRKFVTIVPVTKMSISDDRQTILPEQRFVDVVGPTDFGTEMEKKSLWSWWREILERGHFKS